MAYAKYLLDSDSDEDIGWSRTHDLPKTRDPDVVKQQERIRRKDRGEGEDDAPGPSTKKAKWEPPRSREITKEELEWIQQLVRESVQKKRRTDNGPNWSPQDVKRFDAILKKRGEAEAVAFKDTWKLAVFALNWCKKGERFIYTKEQRRAARLVGSVRWGRKRGEKCLFCFSRQGDYEVPLEKKDEWINSFDSSEQVIAKRSRRSSIETSNAEHVCARHFVPSDVNENGTLKDTAQPQYLERKCVLCGWSVWLAGLEMPILYKEQLKRLEAVPRANYKTLKSLTAECMTEVQFACPTCVVLATELYPDSLTTKTYEKIDRQKRRVAAANGELPEEKPLDRLNIANWPEKLMKTLLGYIPVEGRIKLRSTCKALRSAVDAQPKMITTEVDVRRLNETELGLFIARDEEEGRFVITNKKFYWTEQPLLRTFKEMRRGCIEWTRHDRNRMGRIKTALREMFKLSRIYKLTISQVNLSNSFLRDINRVLSGEKIHSLHLEAQVYEYDRPELRLLMEVPSQSLSLAFRMKEREPLPKIDIFLEEARNKFHQLILEVRQDSWKFKSTLHFRKTYEDFGVTNAFLNHMMSGQTLNFLRLKFASRFITQVGLIHIIKYLRTFPRARPSRGFCVVVHANAARNLIAEIEKMEHFGTKNASMSPIEIPTRERAEKFPTHNTSDEWLEVRPIKQDKDKSPLMEVRYWRKGRDEEVPHFLKREDDDGRFDPFEQPRFLERPA